MENGKTNKTKNKREERGKEAKGKKGVCVWGEGDNKRLIDRQAKKGFHILLRGCFSKVVFLKDPLLKTEL